MRVRMAPVALAAFALFGLSAALASSEHSSGESEELAPPDQAELDSLLPERAAAYERHCPSDRVCSIVVVGAPDGLHTTGEALAKFGHKPSECPAAAAEFEARDVVVDAFVGDCPTAEQAVAIAQGGSPE